jgi:dimethylglycine catabolism A
VAALSEAASGELPLLLRPGRIGHVELRNRIVLPSMTTRAADEEGFVTEDVVAYYVARARGGVGLVTVEMAAPEKVGKHRFRELGIYDDRFLPGLTRLVEAIHAQGAKVAIQLGHGGGHTRADIMGEPPIAPSAVSHPVFEQTMETVIPLEMSAERIATTTRAFVEAARRAARGGFDVVELHAAHGYLLSQFLCPAENRRIDRWGGSLENRARFGLDILRSTKAAAPGLAVIFRLNADDFFPEGMPFEEGQQVAVWAAEAGADAIHVSAGHYRSLPSAAVMIPPMAMPDATFLDMAARIKERVAVPVIAVGRLGDPAKAMAALDEGKADFVALGRALLADPDWVAKAACGEPVRRCIACNSCVDGMRAGGRLHCLVNPTTGRERRFAAAMPPSGERIAVIGAGPAGLAYASLVGPSNSVVVFERDAGPGGAFKLAGRAPLFQEVEAREAPLLEHIGELEAGCRRLGVIFRYGVDPFRASALLAGFDRVVVATGARYPAGLARLVRAALASGMARRRPFVGLFSRAKLRDWFYYRARIATGAGLATSITAPRVQVIGDASRPGKAGDAIKSAYAAACFDDPEALSGAATPTSA